MLQEFTDTAIDFTETEDDAGGGDDDDVDETSAPIVRLVQLMIGEAVQLRASDIHVEPFEDRVRIRYRIDGVLVERDSPPRRLLGRPALPHQDSGQDGHRRAPPLPGRPDQDHRRRQGARPPRQHAARPTTASRASCGCWTRTTSRSASGSWACRRRTSRSFRNLIRRPNGILLVTGPTGSGKTTTLYAALNELNRPDRKIITAEDPVEYYLPGINQVEVKHSIGLDFAQDHSRDVAAGTERDSGRRNARPRNGIDGHSGIANWTLGVQYATYERCARRYYTHGRHGRASVPGGRQRHRHPGPAAGARDLLEVQTAASRPRERELEAAGITPEQAASANFMKGKGCNHCGKSGYRGRLGIFELMTMTSKIRELAFQGASTQDIRKAAIKRRHDNTLRRRHPQGAGRDHDARRGLPRRQEARVDARVSAALSRRLGRQLAWTGLESAISVGRRLNRSSPLSDVRRDALRDRLSTALAQIAHDFTQKTLSRQTGRRIIHWPRGARMRRRAKLRRNRGGTSLAPAGCAAAGTDSARLTIVVGQPRSWRTRATAFVGDSRKRLP